MWLVSSSKTLDVVGFILLCFPIFPPAWPESSVHKSRSAYDLPPPSSRSASISSTILRFALSKYEPIPNYYTPLEIMPRCSVTGLWVLFQNNSGGVLLWVYFFLPEGSKFSSRRPTRTLTPEASTFSSPYLAFAYSSASPSWNMKDSAPSRSPPRLR
jgi:hypothetical protein